MRNSSAQRPNRVTTGEVGLPGPTALRSPEGPYETERMERGARSTDRDPFRFADLLLALEDVRLATLRLSHGERELRMIIELVRSHDLGRVVTSTSLAASSGLTYGTAMRAIDDLLKRGLVIKRPRRIPIARSRCTPRSTS